MHARLRLNLVAFVISLLLITVPPGFVLLSTQIIEGGAGCVIGDGYLVESCPYGDPPYRLRVLASFARFAMVLSFGTIIGGIAGLIGSSLFISAELVAGRFSKPRSVPRSVPLSTPKTPAPPKEITYTQAEQVAGFWIMFNVWWTVVVGGIGLILRLFLFPALEGNWPLMEARFPYFIPVFASLYLDLPLFFLFTGGIISYQDIRGGKYGSPIFFILLHIAAALYILPATNFSLFGEAVFDPHGYITPATVLIYSGMLLPLLPPKHWSQGVVASLISVAGYGVYVIGGVLNW